jgi:hypothetical protein
MQYARARLMDEADEKLMSMTGDWLMELELLAAEMEMPEEFWNRVKKSLDDIANTPPAEKDDWSQQGF